MTIQLARYLPEKPFNSILQRFHPEYWTIDYNALMVGTIIPINARGFKVPAQWRTNSDFMGVRWESEDHYSHDYFKYATDNNYEGTILAFRANPSEPDKFTVTITSFDVAYTYRLSPYVLNPNTGRYEPLDPLYNTNRTYPASVIIPQAEWTAIPAEDMVPFKGRTDYVFILDFDDIRIFSQYDGPIIEPKNISKISFDTLEWSHGLGRDATVTSIVQYDAGHIRMKIVGSVPGSVLSVGDKLTYLARFNVPESRFFGGPIKAKTSLPVPPKRNFLQPWLPARFRTFFFQVTEPVYQIPGTPAFVRISASAQYFEGELGWRGAVTYGPLPVVSMTETYPGTIEVVVDCEGTDFYDPIAKLGQFGNAIYDEYATVSYQDWGVGSRENQVTVTSCSGFGTGEWDVIAEGTIPGPFITCDAFYSRYLSVTSPAEVTNSTKYFVDMTTTGNRTHIALRDHPQPVHDLMMTSGFDDGYNLTPARQVNMVYKLGYRGYWTKYQGMSHYFNGRTAWQDKITGEIIAPGRTNNINVVFAGDHTMAAHFVIERQPARSIDLFSQRAAALFGVATGQVQAINGSIGSTSADRAAAIDPDDPVLDLQHGGAGGLWWWDVDADEPGPALLNCINQASREAKPSAVFWAQGVQDVDAILLASARDPEPSIARTKTALKKIFAYMRQKWGASLPIIVQGLGWAWPADTTFLPPGAATFMSVARNSWGDVVFTWLSYQDDPAPHTYYVDIFHPINTTEVMRTITVPGTQLYNGVLTADYANEINVGDAVAAFGDQFPWSFLRWRVRRAAKPGIEEIVGEIVETLVPEDNNAFVKKVCVLGINSLAGGYFNDLSDPLNPGGTGNPGRKDVVAASTFRKRFAAVAGLRDVEVMPVMTVVGSSPINPMPYQAGFPLDNYWWNPDTHAPGPNLVLANDIVQAIGRAPDYFMESGPGETTGIAFAPVEQRPAILAAFRQSNIEMLAWMRANWGNPALEIWFQGATTSWWGDPPPLETNAEGTQLLRDTQTSIALEGIGFKVGSYVPNSYLYTTYRNEMAEGLGWIHYTVQGYHDAAYEMGESMALDRNLALDPPDWTTLRMPTNIKATKLSNKDIVMTWDARPGAPGWYFVNKRGDTGVPITQGPLTSASYTFTYADQLAAYGAEAHYMNFEVSEYVPASSLRGPTGSFIGDVESPLDLREVTNLRAAKQFNGDVIFTWDGRPEHQDFYIVNKDVSSHAPIFQGALTTQSYVFTYADQVAHYGFPVSFVEFTVAEYDPPSTAVGPEATFNGNASEPVNPLFPISGFEAHFTGAVGFSDVVMTWAASPTPGQQYRVINRRVDNAAIISTTYTTSPTSSFTAAQQTAEYGYTVGYIDVLVCEYDPVNNITGPEFYFYGQPSA